jgi:hypothetical protein
MKKLTLLLVVSAIFFSSTANADEFRTVRVNGKQVISKQPAFAVQTLTAGQTVPNLANGTVIITGINTSATAITGFTGAIAGNIIQIVGNAATTSNATTIADSGAFKLAGAFTATANHTLTLFVRGNGDYVELGRASN